MDTYYAPNVLVDPYYQFGDERSRSELATSLIVGGRLIGIFDVEHTEIDAFSPARVRCSKRWRRALATAIENARLFQRERLEKERALKELEEARQIQAGLFPPQSSALPGFAIDGRCIPCHEVAGDWFDYLPLDDGHLGVVLADVSGKGIRPRS